MSDIAKKARVTVATVSYALRNHPKISAVTRKRIREIADELGYRPAPELARRASRKWAGGGARDMTVGVVDDPRPGGLNPSRAFLAALRRDLHPFGYRPARFLTTDYAGGRQLSAVMHARGIEAVLFGPVYRAEVLEGFEWDRFAAVACAVGYVLPPVDTVSESVLDLICGAVRRVREKGYRRIAVALIKNRRPAVDELEREAGLLMAQRLGGAGCVVQGRICEDEEDFARWFEAFQPDAVIGQTDWVFWWLRGRRAEVPGRVGYASLMCEKDVGPAGIQTTGFVFEIDLLVGRAATMLDSKVRAFKRGRDEQAVRVNVPQLWREGDTLPSR